VLYHDTFWYPLKAKRMMAQVLDSPWGRLFRNWEHVTPHERGYPPVEGPPAEIERLGARALVRSVGILMTCLKEAPEFAMRRQRAQIPKSPSHQITN